MTHQLTVIISAAVSCLLLIAQLTVVVIGTQTSAKQISAFQVLFHGAGALALVWMLLDRWPTILVPIIGVFTVLIPFILEITLIIGQRTKFNIIYQIHQE